MFFKGMSTIPAVEVDRCGVAGADIGLEFFCCGVSGFNAPRSIAGTDELTAGTGDVGVPEPCNELADCERKTAAKVNVKHSVASLIACRLA